MSSIGNPEPVMRLSVVIPARNAAHFLPACLAALKAGLGPRAEVIVVDDASTDGTAQAVLDHGAELVRLPERKGAAAARNLGVAKAPGDVILFVDADCVLQSGAWNVLVEAFDNPEFDGIVGCYDANPAAPGLVSKFRNLLHSYIHRRAHGDRALFWCGCGAVRRQALIEAGGFDEGAQWLEDIEFGARLSRHGRVLRMESRLQVRHLKQWTLTSMIRTDVCRRAIPWTRLIWRSGTLPDCLNVSTDQRLSVALTGFAMALAVLSVSHPLALAGIMACIAGIAAINRDFYRFLNSTGWRGPFGLALTLHLIYFCCAGVGFIAGSLLTIGEMSRVPSRPVPSSPEEDAG